MIFSNTFFIQIAAIISDIVFMYSGFALFSMLKVDYVMEIQILPWVFYSILCLMINTLLLKKKIKENTYMTISIILGIIGVIFGNIFFVNASGFVAYGFSTLFIVISIIRCYMLPREGVKPNQMLIYVEFSIMALCIIFMIERYYVDIRGLISKKFIISITLDLISLILIRVSGSGNEKYDGGKVKGVFFVAAITAIAGTFALGFLLILSDGFSSFMTGIVNFIVGVLSFLKNSLLEFMLFLLSLLPEGEGYELVAQEQAASGAAQETFILNSDKLNKFLIIVAALVIIWLFVKMFIRNKNKRTSLTLDYSDNNYRKSDISFFKAIMIAIVKIKKSILFRFNCFKYRNSLEGLYIYILEYGKVLKVPKNEYETLRCYIKRLSENLEENKAIALNEFSNMFEAKIYGGKVFSREKADVARIKKILNEKL